MTDLDVPCDEPELPELCHLRELSRLETAPALARERILARAQLTLREGQVRGVGGGRRMLLAALLLVGVPSAFAATPFGARRLGAWLEPEVLPQRSTVVASNAAKMMAPRPDSAGPAASPAPHHEEVSSAPREPVAPVARLPLRPEPQTALSSESQAESRGEPRPELGASLAEDPAMFSPPRREDSVRAFPLAETRNVDPAGSPATSTTLDAETQLLQQARLRLAARDAEAALQLAAEHRRRFPNGVLRQERMGIEQQAWALAAHPGGN
jgi:hypothetical protein